MKIRHSLSLRARIAVAMLALVAFSAVVVAVLAHFTGERLEEGVNYDLLAEELTHYEHRLRSDPGAAPLHSALLHIYRSSDIAQLPREIARLKPGVHHAIRRDGRSLRVLVRDGEFGRLYITYDVSDHERGQRWALLVLIAGVAGTLALTTWAAFRLSRQLVGPVHELAERLSTIDPSERKMRIAQGFMGNELEPIARSIDTFLERLDGFVEREQAFTATASHELRTPLAVIQGAVELLTEQHGGQASTQNALARIQRAVREMSEFTSALLSLARESDTASSHSTECDVAAILPRIVEDQRAIAPDKVVKLAYSAAETLRVRAPDSMVAMVIGNIVRNALQHGAGNTIHCQLHERTLKVENGGTLAAGVAQRLFERNFSTRPGGHGMGLSLAQRICERYGWRIEFSSVDETTAVTLSF
ncbi:MAG: HAMP domain-containing histidine kinase [Candidatus Obscuribacterales bacterium]|nr:HAMP domain-containing histidine kinase [Steroidobacteraceae bacterium]